MTRHHSSRRDRWIAILGLAALLATHFDFWRDSASSLVLDALPSELLYRLAWMGGAYAYLLFFTARIWRREPRSPEASAE